LYGTPSPTGSYEQIIFKREVKIGSLKFWKIKKKLIFLNLQRYDSLPK